MNIFGKVIGNAVGMKKKPSVLKRAITNPEDFELVARIEGDEINVHIREKKEEPVDIPALNESDKKDASKVNAVYEYVKDWAKEYEDQMRNVAANYLPKIVLTVPVIIVGGIFLKKLIK